MPLKPLDAPCWRLVNPDGVDYDEGEGTQHFTTAAEADTYARDYLHADGLTAKQWDRPCLLVFCDRCGAEFNDGVWAHTHFPDEKAAQAVAEYDDYRVEETPGGAKVFCPDCPDLTDEDN